MTEQVVADGDLGDVLVVQGLASAAQHFHRSFRERHVESLQLPAGLGCYVSWLKSAGIIYKYVDIGERLTYMHGKSGYILRL